MIKSIEVKNFKSIKRKVFELRNLNVLVGLNGMGKSSFIHSLLSMRQSSRFQNLELRLNGEYVKLGTTKDTLYQYSKKEDLSFNLEFQDGETTLLDFNYSIESDVFTLKNERVGNILFKNQSLFTNNFQYLNANRQGPTSIHSKNYSSVVTNRNVGWEGEFTAHFIEVHGNDEIVFENLLHKNSISKDSVTGKELVNKTLLNQINLWMGEISPDINIRTTSINSENVLMEYVFLQRNFGTTNKFKPSNVGFGISYALPVITALLASKPGELIIIENPESHIHPRGQAELGRLISLVAKNDVQVIVETHSDHILNGIRVAVKENPTLAKKVVSFFFERVVEESEQYSKISTIEIGENGELSEYPVNLLEEWGNQLIKLV